MLEVLDDDGFAAAPSSWDFQFPADHGSHDEYRSEWWYLSGTLQDESHNYFGVQFVLMRIGLTAVSQARRSRWATPGIYAGLFSITDPAGDRLRADRRVSRAALGLAGTAIDPAQLWIENWRLEQIGINGRALDLGMHIATDDLTLDLELHNTQPLIDANDLRGQRVEESTPFRFYLQPRLRAKGTLRVGDQRTAVNGTLTMEHAWGELPLPGSPVARDRFVLYLGGERVLICVRTHRVDGSGTPTTTGLLIGHNKRPIVVSSSEMALDPVEHWTSVSSGRRYPVRWALQIPGQGIKLELIPYWNNQEETIWAPFWAGPVRLRGPVAMTVGNGFMQLNGYHGQ
jgi:predicted secreted hydrolase